MNRRAAIILAAVFGGFFLLFLGFLAVAWSVVHASSGDRFSSRGMNTHGPKIGVIELKGVIGEDKGIQGTSEVEQIHEFAEDDDIKAIIVRINSPGGAVAPSQEINEEITRTREKKHKKVICSQGNIAASGGYYISVACDKIVADAGTLTGSIGVISEFIDAQDLVSKAHVQTTTLKTGPFKDSGSPLREFNDQDRTYFDGLMHGIYMEFVQAVADGRHMKVDDVLKLADGRVYSGLEAKKLGLVDELGNFRTAVDITMREAHLEGDPQLVYPEKKGPFQFLEMLKDGASSAGAGLAQGAVGSLQSKLGLEGGIMLLAPGFSLNQ